MVIRTSDGKLHHGLLAHERADEIELVEYTDGWLGRMYEVTVLPRTSIANVSLVGISKPEEDKSMFYSGVLVGAGIFYIVVPQLVTFDSPVLTKAFRRDGLIVGGVAVGSGLLSYLLTWTLSSDRDHAGEQWERRRGKLFRGEASSDLGGATRLEA